MIGTLDQAKVTADAVAAVAWLKARPDGNGKVGIVGFCWGGGVVGRAGGADARPRRRPSSFYGRRRRAEDVADDQGAAAAALCRARRAHQRRHPGVRGGAEGDGKYLHALHVRGRQPRLQQRHLGGRYNEAAAKLAWQRTVDFFKANLAAG